MLFIFFLIIDLFFLLPAVIAQVFNPIAELILPIGIRIKEAKAEMDTHPVIVKAKISVQYDIELYKPFCGFYSIYLALFLPENNFLFRLHFLF